MKYSVIDISSSSISMIVADMNDRITEIIFRDRASLTLLHYLDGHDLLLTQKMFDDLRLMRPDAWLDWQLIEEHNNEWCVVRADFRRQTFRVLKNFYVRMQVTRFFHQGYTLIESGHSQVLAALSPDGRKLAVAVLNPANAPCRFRLNLGGFSLRRAAVEGWRTSATEDCRPLPASELPAGEQWEYLAPAQSLTTFVVSAKRRGLVR